MYGMDNRVANEVRVNLDKIDFKGKRVFIFGANNFCSYIIDRLRESGITVEKIIDNSKEKIGTYAAGVEVASAEDCLLPIINDALILIASQHIIEMSEQLEMYGYDKKNIISILNVYRHKTYFKNNHIMLDELYELIDKARIGEETIKEIRRKYGEDVYILYIPLASLGDTYLLCTYIQAYLRNKQIEKFVFLLHGKAATKMLKNIGFSDVLELEDSSANENVLYYFKLNSYKEKRIILLLYDILHTQIVAGMLCYQKSTMLDGYRIWYDINENAPKCLPQLKYSDEDVKEITHRFNIEKDHSVILAPYANSVRLLDFEFWEKLSNRLSDRGFKVYTNVSKDSESVIPGTNPIMFDVDIAQPILEEAGFFVGLRSGFCDVVCNAECEKIILYPEWNFEIGEVYDACSFERMKIGKKIYEIKIKYGDDYAELLEKIENLIIR